MTRVDLYNVALQELRISDSAIRNEMIDLYRKFNNRSKNFIFQEVFFQHSHRFPENTTGRKIKKENLKGQSKQIVPILRSVDYNGNNPMYCAIYKMVFSSFFLEKKGHKKFWFKKS